LGREEIERLIERYDKLKSKEEWRAEEQRLILDATARRIELSRSERMLAQHLLSIVQKEGINRIHPHMSVEELAEILCYIALQHWRPRQVVHAKKPLFSIPCVNHRPFVVLSKILSLYIRDQPLRPSRSPVAANDRF